MKENEPEERGISASKRELAPRDKREFQMSNDVILGSARSGKRDVERTSCKVLSLVQNDDVPIS